MKKNCYFLLIGLIIAPIAQLEAADNVHVYRTAPSAAQLAHDLAAPTPAAASHTRRQRSRTRSIVFDSAPDAASQQRQRQESSTSKPSRVLVFPIYFPSNSAKITPKAAPFIDSVAELMKMDPSLKFQVEGHTDSKGSPAINMTLSQRRAEAVTSYLIHQQSIDSSRLTPVGKGSKEPLEGVSPRSATNRRVQFRTM